MTTIFKLTACVLLAVICNRAVSVRELVRGHFHRKDAMAQRFRGEKSLTQTVNGQSVDLEKQNWIHGSADCRENLDPGLQVVKFDETTYIIRQNKCLNYEAPFIYLFIGRRKALLVDTGAEAPDESFPLYETVNTIIKQKNGLSIPLIVIHSHGHSDHTAGDHQFINKQNVRLIPPNKDSIVAFFQLKHWPEGIAKFNLGDRELTILPIPGHDEMSVAVYDPQTRWLLTGDSIYPGRLYVRNGDAFRASISRLYSFSKEYPVSYLMGNHIEMTGKNGKDYPVGTTYQPDEHQLPLGVAILEEIFHACEKMDKKISYETHDNFIIVPK